MNTAAEKAPIEVEAITRGRAPTLRARPITIDDSSPAGMIAYAMRANASVAELRELYAFKQEFDADQAKKAYVAAMAAFKAEPLQITKDKHVKFTTSKGITEYDHATIGNVTSVICAALGQHGFSHRWDTDQQDGGRIVVTCIITHELGHAERTTLKASADESGGKNNIQALASTVTYLQRYTLLAATGMATSDQEDDDGRGARASGGEQTTDADDSPEREKLVADLYSAADTGMEALMHAWKELSEASRKMVGSAFGAIKKRAESVS